MSSKLKQCYNRRNKQVIAHKIPLISPETKSTSFIYSGGKIYTDSRSESHLN